MMRGRLHRDPVRVRCASARDAFSSATSPTVRFANRYDGVVPQSLDTPWQEMFARLKADPDAFQYLNAAQLVKHALGLRRLCRT